MRPKSRLKKKCLFILLVSLNAIFLTHCTGYQLGGAQPKKYQHIKNISVIHARNLTFEPTLSALFTGIVIDKINHDGTYKVTSDSAADATLSLSVNKLNYRRYSPNRFDTASADELKNKLHVSWKLVQNNQTIGSGIAIGETNFFTAENLEIAKQNAIPLAADDAAEKIIFVLTQGF